MKYQALFCQKKKEEIKYFRVFSAVVVTKGYGELIH